MSHVSLQDFLKTEPDGTLEAIAAQYNTTLLEVVKNLPSPTLVSGDQFDTVWETVSEWGKVTTLVVARQSKRDTLTTNIGSRL